MNRYALVSNGPSAQLFKDSPLPVIWAYRMAHRANRDRGDLIVCHDSDPWLAQDFPCDVVTSPGAMEWAVLNKHPILELEPGIYRHRKTRLTVSSSAHPTGYTGLLMLWVAWSLGRTRLMLYGFDMTGKQDATGHEGSESRSEHRWQIERRLFAELVAKYKLDIHHADHHTGAL